MIWLLAPPIPSHLSKELSFILSLLVCMSLVKLNDVSEGRGRGGGGVWSQIIRRRKSLVLYNCTLNTCCLGVEKKYMSKYYPCFSAKYLNICVQFSLCRICNLENMLSIIYAKQCTLYNPIKRSLTRDFRL
jgi:hypothetical protein